MNRPPELTPKLKASDVEIKNYLLALEKENLTLQGRIAKFQGKDVSQQHEIASLKKAQPKLVIRAPKATREIFFAKEDDKNKKTK